MADAPARADKVHETKAPVAPRGAMSRRYLLDLAERVVATYAVTFFGMWIASGVGIVAVSNIDLADRALVATLPTLLALAKGVLAKLQGDPNSASLVSVKPPAA